MNAFKTTLFAAAAVVSSLFGADAYAAGPAFYSTTPSVAGSGVTYARYCTPNGCYLVPVTPQNDSAGTNGIGGTYRPAATYTAPRTSPFYSSPTGSVPKSSPVLVSNPRPPVSPVKVTKPANTSSSRPSPFYP